MQSIAFFRSVKNILSISYLSWGEVGELEINKEWSVPIVNTPPLLTRKIFGVIYDFILKMRDYFFSFPGVTFAVVTLFLDDFTLINLLRFNRKRLLGLLFM